VIYLDTSALIKRYVVERGSPIVQKLVSGGDAIATSMVAFAEVYSGLMRKRREGFLTPRAYATARRQFEAEWNAYTLVSVGQELLDLARNLIEKHPLRSFDAIHLASGVRLKTDLEEEVTLAAADDRLLKAGKAEGLKALHVETGQVL
jgi:predicted nucleic acid-binding protein